MSTLAQRIADRDGGVDAQNIAWRLRREHDSESCSRLWAALEDVAPAAFAAVVDEDVEQAHGHAWVLA